MTPAPSGTSLDRASRPQHRVELAAGAQALHDLDCRGPRNAPFLRLADDLVHRVTELEPQAGGQPSRGRDCAAVERAGVTLGDERGQDREPLVQLGAVVCVDLGYADTFLDADVGTTGSWGSYSPGGLL